MEPDKALNEALLRSHQATEKANQAQHQLHNMAAPGSEKEDDQPVAPQPVLHESPKNVLESWNTLRKLDEDLAERKAEGTEKKETSNTGNPPANQTK